MPGPTPRKQAKVLDAGARVEDRLLRRLTGRKVMFDAWRLPGVRIERVSGVNYHPDAAGYLADLAGLVTEVTPQVAGRPNYNVLFEFKGQVTTGSAEKKISAAIEDLAHACDELGVPGVVILHTPVLTERQIESYKRLGRLHSVVVLEDNELSRDLLTDEIVRVAKERRRLRRRIGAGGGYTPTKRPPVYESGLAYRVRVRSLNGQRIRFYKPVAG